MVPMHKVLIIGSNGVIGSVLKQGLPHDTTDFDLPTDNASDYKQIVQKAAGHDAIVHLAWDFTSDGWLGESLNPTNALITFNVYQAAMDAGVKRVIMASSVHADRFTHRELGGKLMDPYALPLPDSPYGAGKCMLESLGRYYADAKGLEVICIRFGGINRQNQPVTSPDSERQVWLSHRDCVSLVQKCLEAPSIPDNYAIVYAVSDNRGRLHDLTNPFGWHPLDSA
jgi:uronate dehydrogenase